MSFKKVWKNLITFFAEDYERNKLNIEFGKYIAFIGHVGYWFLWTYIFPQQYDSAFVRFTAIGLFIPFLFKKFIPDNVSSRGLLGIYWYLCVGFNLPFLFTYMMLMNNFSGMWLICMTMSISMTIILIPKLIIFIIVFGFGIVFAYGTFLTQSSGIIFNTIHLEYLLVIPMVIGGGILFNFSAKYGELKLKLSEERAKIFKSLAGSIAHEIRNPLNAINLIGRQINDLAADLDRQNGSGYQKYNSENLMVPDVSIIPTAKSKLLDLTSHISDLIANANNIINIILGDLSEREIDPEDFVYLEPAKILPDIIEKYVYGSNEERAKVKLLPLRHEEDNFLFKAIPDRLTYIIFNLLKNALYYLNQFPESVVIIGTEKRVIGGTGYNVIYVNDTGPGIPPHIIPKLFEDFYTSGKKEGTGLGLSFCKRNMQMFGGDIICESEYGKWTRFSLLFPKLSDEEVKQAKLESRKRKILLVDDQEVNLLTTKSRLEKILPYISCDIARSGKEAINMVKQQKYYLILMDIEMPDINGIEVTKKIRSYNKEVPIITFTSLSRDLFLKMINEEMSKSGFNYYLSKSSLDNLLYRGVSKWITDPQDDLSYVGTKEDYLKILHGKKVILADDQQINRLMTKRILESAGLIVMEANDGKELVELYRKSLDAEGISDFDIMITDVSMPPHDGDIAAKEIRNIEASYKISHHDEMPIIALSGDGEKEDIHHFFECQMTDYFIKGSKPELLLKIIANYLIKRETKPENGLDINDLSSLEKFQILDKTVLECFDREEQAMIFDLFINDTDKTMSKITESKNAGDEKNLLLHIHSLKGTSANIGASRLFNYVKIIEPKIKDGSASQNWIKDLEKIYSDLKSERLKVFHKESYIQNNSRKAIS